MSFVVESDTMKQLHTTLASLIFFVAFSLSVSAQYTIPVVVHVIHNNGPENISDALVLDAIAEVNRNFNAQNASLAGVASPFVGVVGNMQIEFCLAHTDPQGLATSGIEHVVSPLTYRGDSDAVKIGQWPSDRYLNIWVVDSLRPLDLVSYLPGRATKPLQAVADTSKDGVVAGYFTFLPGQRGLLTNFIGQYFNLCNIWGNTNEPEVACGDDSIADTPITKGSMFMCDTSASFCNPPVVENIQNFMNWSSCTCMFTAEQVARVHRTLNDSYAHRSHLWSQSNLAVTCAEPTGFHDPGAYAITAGPNPFTDEIVVHGLRPGSSNIQLYDAQGRCVSHTEDNTLHVADLASGVYAVVIKNNDTVRSIKVVKSQN